MAILAILVVGLGGAQGLRAAPVMISGALLPSRHPAPASPQASVGPYSFALPALGIEAPIRDLPACGGDLPDAGLWAWNCGGADNLVLIAHAYGAFSSLYDGYHSGELRTGLLADYRDGAGAHHPYYVAQIWHLAVADAFSGWAWAPEEIPVITLITCDGPTDAYRIIVRLIPVGSTNPDPTSDPRFSIGPEHH